MWANRTTKRVLASRAVRVSSGSRYLLAGKLAVVVAGSEAVWQREGLCDSVLRTITCESAKLDAYQIVKKENM